MGKKIAAAVEMKEGLVKKVQNIHNNKNMQQTFNVF